MIEPRFCSACGRPRLETARFCGGCGADLGAKRMAPGASVPASDPGAVAAWTPLPPDVAAIPRPVADSWESAAQRRRIPMVGVALLLLAFVAAGAAGLGAFALVGGFGPGATAAPAIGLASPSGPAPSAATAPGPSAYVGAFVRTGSMTTQRDAPSATLLPDGRVLIAGGSRDGSTSALLASAELYDPASGTFSPTGSMATARLGHIATLLRDGRILIVGGTGGSAPGPVSSAEVYDPHTGTFSLTGSLTMARFWPTVTLLPDGHVLITGGYPSSDLGSAAVPLATAELYDPQSGTFSPTGPMTIERGFPTASLLPDGRVLIAGGVAAGFTPLISAELYDPQNGTFSPTGSMATARALHTATLLLGGQVLVAGGMNGSAVSSSSELYDPESGTFSPTGSMSVARSVAVSASLSDGRVLIAGGQGQDSDSSVRLSSADLYDPATGTFRLTGPMTSARAGSSATLLANGDVLFAGGESHSLVVLSSAELFQ